MVSATEKKRGRRLERDDAVDASETVEPETASPDVATSPEARKDAKLDQAIEQSFPASDPISTGHPTGDDTPPGSRVDRRAPVIDHALVERLAKRVRREVE